MKPNISMTCKKSPFFSTGKSGSKTIAPKEHFPQILALTLKLTQTLTPAGGGGQFSLGDCPEPGKNKRNEKPKRNRKQ